MSSEDSSGSEVDESSEVESEEEEEVSSNESESAEEETSEKKILSKRNKPSRVQDKSYKRNQEDEFSHLPPGKAALMRVLAGKKEEDKEIETEEIENGNVMRTSILPMLTVAGEEDCVPLLRRQFKLPRGLVRTEQDSELLKVKTLGPRRVWSTGISFPKRFILPMQIVADDGAQVEMPKIIDKTDYTGVEPLVLWESPDAETNPNAPAPIVVDLFLCKFLRPHQRDGVRFMAECVTGQREYEGLGVILADDMGLGKTLQSITLLYTLLTQGMTGNGVPLVNRAIIVCPTSLVSNWANEIKKWCGERVKAIALSESSKDKVIMGINDFLSPRRESPILIISYETFRLHYDRFTGNFCDLLIADEAHRLKNAETQTYTVLASLPCKRRVLLSGTPMQNNLEEFFAMVDLINPGILGDEKSFRRVYQNPILAGREPGATDAERSLAAERSAQLSVFVNRFVLRRTNTLLSKHLPPKIIEVVCCRPSPLQTALYDHFLKSKAVKNLLNDSEAGGGLQILPLITSLKKLCNHPRLIYDEAKQKGKKSPGLSGVEDFFPPDFDRQSKHQFAPEMSGKMDVLDRLLTTVRLTTDDRFVLISNFTQTLDLFAALCRLRGWPYVRLDGGTAVKKRQKLVDQLTNRSQDTYIFLLSSKAGGCGLNLIGANRLVLFDPDWNPAVDKQAAARIWRDGQKKRCYVYRFLTTGTIEEKVYQRQLSKEGLQNVIGAGTADQVDVSAEDLRDLFTLRHDTISDTHDTLSCGCCNNTELISESIETKDVAVANKVQGDHPKEEDLENWAHHKSVVSVDDEAFRVSHPPSLDCDSNFVSFVFTCHVDGQLEVMPSLPPKKAGSMDINKSASVNAPRNSSRQFSGTKPMPSYTLKPLHSSKPVSTATVNPVNLIAKTNPPNSVVSAVKQIDSKVTIADKQLPSSTLENSDHQNSSLNDNVSKSKNISHSVNIADEIVSNALASMKPRDIVSDKENMFTPSLLSLPCVNDDFENVPIKVKSRLLSKKPKSNFDKAPVDVQIIELD